MDRKAAALIAVSLAVLGMECASPNPERVVWSRDFKPALSVRATTLTHPADYGGDPRTIPPDWAVKCVSAVARHFDGHRNSELQENLDAIVDAIVDGLKQTGSVMLIFNEAAEFRVTTYNDKPYEMTCRAGNAGILFFPPRS
jgi:hypothetical protein